MNKAIIIGNLTKNPELRYSTGQSQIAVCRFTVAVNDKRKNPQTGAWEDNPSFIPVVVFGKQAENCDKFLSKGSKAGVVGRIQTGSYVNKEGTKVYTTDLVAESVEFLSHNDGMQNQTPQYQPQYPQQEHSQPQYQAPQHQPYQPTQTTAYPQMPQSPQTPQQVPMGGFTALQDDDIPF